MRLVLDTNVAVSAVLGSSAPSRLVELAERDKVELFSSAALVSELADVLSRPSIAQRLQRRQRSATQVLKLYETLVELVVPASITRTAADPDDDMLLACGLAARAQLIVSGDTHLRNLKSFQRMPIVSPAQALSIIVPQG